MPTPTLTLATDSEKAARDRVTWPAWGRGLSLVQWLEREEHLRAHAWSRLAMETWLWKNAGGRVLSSCETFRNTAALGQRAGEVYAVASVFTEEALRGRGHATAMVGALGAALAARPGALGSVLFSDVGAALYARSGYRAAPAVDVVLPPEPGDPHEGVTPLTAPASAPSSPPAGADTLVLTPTAAQLDWHLARERFYARVLSRPGAPFPGARAGEAEGLWAASLKDDELLVLWLTPGAPGDTARVLRCAQRAAHAAGLSRVRVWEPHPGFAALPGPRTPRRGELPMLRAFVSPAPGWRQVHRGLWV